MHSLNWTVCSTPTEFYALTTYHSQLVLVGGIKAGRPTNQLWTSHAGLDWKASLPPKRTACYWSSAVNTGSPENLIVAGGRGGTGNVSTVEVFTDLDKQWWIVKDLPRRCACMKCTLHDGNVYLKVLIGVVMYITVI